MKKRADHLRDGPIGISRRRSSLPENQRSDLWPVPGERCLTSGKPPTATTKKGKEGDKHLQPEKA
jgi:hypothetical protein